MNEPADALSQCHAKMTGHGFDPSYEGGTIRLNFRVCEPVGNASFFDVAWVGPATSVGHVPFEYVGNGGGVAFGVEGSPLEDEEEEEEELDEDGPPLEELALGAPELPGSFVSVGPLSAVEAASPQPKRSASAKAGVQVRHPMHATMARNRRSRGLAIVS
jgi:hypothetical protein